MSLPKLIVGSLLRVVKYLLRRPQCVSTDVQVVPEACRIAEEERNRICTGDFQSSAFAADGPSFVFHSQDRRKSHSWLGPGTSPGPGGILAWLDLAVQFERVVCNGQRADFRLGRV